MTKGSHNAKKRLDALEYMAIDLAKQKGQEVKRSICSYSFLVMAAKTLLLVLLYYIFSISLTFYNQRFIHTFKFPLSITMVHLITKFAIVCALRQIVAWRTGQERVTLPWKQYIFKIAPPGITSSLDIGLSNWSFEFITVSLYTMTKSSSIIFILLFAILFGLEQFRCMQIVVILFIAVGLFLFTYQSTQFHMEGFLMVLSASILSGLRWTLAQKVLQKSELGLTNPIDMMYHIQPWMILTLLPLSAGFEGISIATTDQGFNWHEYHTLFRNIGLLLIGSVVACAMEFSEFLLVSQTSSLTLSISGVFKEVCTLYLAVEFNGDKMNTINAMGLVICLAGIVIHVIIKAVNSKTSVVCRPLYHHVTSRWRCSYARIILKIAKTQARNLMYLMYAATGSRFKLLT